MASSVRPFLMFQGGKAEEAMNFYISVLPGAITQIDRYGSGQPGPEGTVRLAEFQILGQTVLCIDSPIPHEFNFTPSFSFFVDCQSEDEILNLSKTLGEGGATLMPLNNYGFSRLFTWLVDRFGVSWQLNLV